MVAGAFPLIKLGALLLRQVSKPIVNYTMQKAKSNEFFRKYVCMPPAQIYNWFEIKTKMWILNLGKPVNIPVLNEAMAIELGANLLGESIVFTLAAAILISEYNRGRKNEEIKENARKQELSDIVSNLQELALRLEAQDAQLREISRRVLSYKDIKKIEEEIALKKIKPPTSEPPPPSATPATPPSDVSAPANTVNTTETVKNPKPSNLVLKTTDKILEDLTGDHRYYKDSGLIMDALRYIQYDVCRGTIVVK